MAIEWAGYTLTFSTGRYPNNRPAILLMQSSFTKYGPLSTNIPALALAPDEFFVPVWNFRDDLLALILESGEVQDTGKRAYSDSWNETSEGPEPQIWRIVSPALRAELNLD